MKQHSTSIPVFFYFEMLLKPPMVYNTSSHHWNFTDSHYLFCAAHIHSLMWHSLTHSLTHSLAVQHCDTSPRYWRNCCVQWHCTDN